MVSNKARADNNRQRIEWVEYWVGYMKKTTNEVWSKQQADFINSVMKSADVNPETYLKIKNMIEKKNRSKEV